MCVVAYRFGRFVLDCETRELLRDGVEIRVSPKAFELLAMLVRNRTRAVSKAELLEKLWPSTFVEETNLASLAAEIRRALGDDASAPAFLRTIHRFGYRFVGDVAESDPTLVGRTVAKPCLIYENRTMILLEGANILGRAGRGAQDGQRRPVRAGPAHGFGRRQMGEGMVGSAERTGEQGDRDLIVLHDKSVAKHEPSLVASSEQMKDS